MLKRFGLILVSLLLLGGCGQPLATGKVEKVGLLVPETINDQVWGTKGYRGLLQIQSSLGVDVFFKEGMNSQEDVEAAVKEFDRKGVNLIYGHGNEYAAYFNKISGNYPDIHFISFNGDARTKNTTSLNFKGYAMGFLAEWSRATCQKPARLGSSPHMNGSLKSKVFMMVRCLKIKI